MRPIWGEYSHYGGSNPSTSFQRVTVALSSTDFNELLDADHAPAIVARDDGEVSIEPSSIDLHLGPDYGWFENQKRPISVWKEETYPEFVPQYNDSEILVRPHEFLLAHTSEIVHLPEDCVGFLHGRSSVGRLGMFVHNAGLVDASFSGDLTLEIYNASQNTIVLKPGMRICQMTVHAHDSAPDVGYSERNGNKYQGQRGPTQSRLFEDFE